ISAKSNYNIEKPYVMLLSKLVGDPNIQLVQQPAPLPPEIVMESSLQAQIENDVRELDNLPLPMGESDIPF
ncbi:MAG: hypothetical protein EZS28_047779, partial [Streblomastix strix]